MLQFIRVNFESSLEGKHMQKNEKPSVVVVGGGAIGSSVAAWVSPKYDALSLLARGESAEVIEKQGLSFYLKGGQDKAVLVPIKIIRSLDECPDPDVVVITVKNYDLEATAKMLREQLGSHQPIVVGLQNGVENQQILPRYFSRVVYGVVCFNAWRDGPGKVGHQKRGFVILGTPKNDLQPEMQLVAGILRLGLDCSITDRLEDAVYCKLVINLGNALTSLTGFQEHHMKSFDALTRLTAGLIWEGIRVIQANGFKEHPLGKIPSWSTIRMSATLPRPVTSVFYRFAMREELGPNSTEQDLAAGKANTELESFNGYMLTLARKVGIPMPINQAVYEIAKERFGPNFKPMPEKELVDAIQRKLR